MLTANRMQSYQCKTRGTHTKCVHYKTLLHVMTVLLEYIDLAL